MDEKYSGKQDPRLGDSVKTPGKARLEMAENCGEGKIISSEMLIREIIRTKREEADQLEVLLECLPRTLHHNADEALKKLLINGWR